MYVMLLRYTYNWYYVTFYVNIVNIRRITRERSFGHDGGQFGLADLGIERTHKLKNNT